MNEEEKKTLYDKTTATGFETIKITAEDKDANICTLNKDQCKELLNLIEKNRLTLFMVVRNSQVLPTGMKLNKTEKEISDMTKQVIKKVENMINFDKARELYGL